MPYAYGWRHVARPWRLRALPRVILRRTSVMKRGSPKRKKPKLEDLPEDILTSIFLHACTDGGQTGCSLSLVSRRIHEASRVARYNTVSLLSGSLSRTRRFLESYEHAAEAANVDGTAAPTINNLALVLTPLLTEPLAGINPTPYERARVEHQRLLLQEYGDDSRQWRGHVAVVAHEYFAAAQSVLEAAAEDVQTLCLYHHSAKSRAFDRVESPIICLTKQFARLRELSFVGDEPHIVCELAEGGGYDHVPPFPALERLHAMRGSKSVMSPERWIRDAPNLTLLRVTWLRGIPERSFMEHLRDVVAFFNIEPDRENLPVRKVIFTARPPPMKASPTKIDKYYNMMCDFRADIWNVHMPVVFAPYYWDQDVSEKVWKSALINEGALWKDWLARCSGSKGVFKRNFWSKFMSDEWMDRAEICLHTGAELYLSPLITVRGMSEQW